MKKTVNLLLLLRQLGPGVLVMLREELFRTPLEVMALPVAQ